MLMLAGTHLQKMNAKLMKNSKTNTGKFVIPSPTIHRLLGLMCLLCLCDGTSASGAPKPVEEFVRTQFTQGIPMSEAKLYTAADVPTLIGMLNEPADSRSWANIVATLGIIGDDQGVAALIQFIEGRFAGIVDLETFNALINVSPALGHAAFRGNAKALKYLIDNHTIRSWTAKQLKWSFGKYHGKELAVLLCKIHMRGLANSCKPPAKELLIKMASDEGEDYRELRTVASDNISESAKFLDYLEAVGQDRAFKVHQR